jgi:hypothetical protein
MNGPVKARAEALVAALAVPLALNWLSSFSELAFLQAYNRAKAVNSSTPKTVSFLIGLKFWLEIGFYKNGRTTYVILPGNAWGD